MAVSFQIQFFAKPNDGGGGYKGGFGQIMDGHVGDIFFMLVDVTKNFQLKRAESVDYIS